MSEQLNRNEVDPSYEELSTAILRYAATAPSESVGQPKGSYPMYSVRLDEDWLQQLGLEHYSSYFMASDEDSTSVVFGNVVAGTFYEKYIIYAPSHFDGEDYKDDWDMSPKLTLDHSEAVFDKDGLGSYRDDEQELSKAEFLRVINEARPLPDNLNT